jgi:hypothetical protein
MTPRNLVQRQNTQQGLGEESCLNFHQLLKKAKLGDNT